ncbi:MAG: VIT and VWA domain-containing protein [Planctomycetales bacterium]|nr:VIT and VWA domain-containing protein [Planctomycetales bacterium]
MTVPAFRHFRLLSMAILVGACWHIQSAQSEASGLLIADGGLGGALEIKEHDVSVVINNGIAVTEVRQIFHNTEQRIVEALYTFPVPAGASVSNFSMIINGKEMIGEVVEKKRARQIYESYKTVKRDPGLLEQVDYKTFELRIFPIPAGADQHIKVTYCQQLDFDHNNATWVYPLSTTTRKDINQKTTGKFSLTVDIKSEIPITKLVSPSHEQDFAITSYTPNYTRASLEVQKGDLSRDVVIAFDTERARTGVDMIASKQQGEDGYFLMTVTAGKELEEYGAGMDYVFVMDISGSMSNDGKLTQSRNTIDSFVTTLGTEDRFEIITFNNAPQMHFGQMTVVSDQSRKSAEDFLSSQRAKGGTSLRPAVTTAYKYKDGDRPLNVVVLSDGMTETNEQSELLRLIADAPSGTRVFCVGIGNDVNRPLLKQLAEGAGGLAAFVSQQDDFARQAQAFRRKLMRPVATGVRIQVNGIETSDVTPDALPDLFYGAPLRLSGRYKNSGDATITIEADVMGQPISQTVQVKFPEVEDKNPEIERVWAFQQVEQLMADIRKNGESSAAVAKIISLCEGYSIVGEYASFIVLENDAEYGRWAIARRNAIRVTRDDKARLQLQQQLQLLRDSALAQSGPAAPENVAASESTQQDLSQTVPASAASPASVSPAIAPVQTTPTDLNWAPSSVPSASPSSSGGGGNGGGAIDPITGLFAAGLAASAILNRKRRTATPHGQSSKSS